MNIKNRPFDPTLLIKTTLPEEAGDTINYSYYPMFNYFKEEQEQGE